MLSMFAGALSPPGELTDADATAGPVAAALLVATNLATLVGNNRRHRNRQNLREPRSHLGRRGIWSAAHGWFQISRSRGSRRPRGNRARASRCGLCRKQIARSAVPTACQCRLPALRAQRAPLASFGTCTSIAAPCCSLLRLAAPCCALLRLAAPFCTLLCLAAPCCRRARATAALFFRASPPEG